MIEVVKHYYTFDAVTEYEKYQSLKNSLTNAGIPFTEHICTWPGFVIEYTTNCEYHFRDKLIDLET